MGTDTSRRRFLRAATGVSAVATTGLVSFGSSAEADVKVTTETVTLWRLNSKWGYPAGDKDKTSCECSACHRHGANKIFFTQEAAISGRIHKCCVCQPESFTVTTTAASQLLAQSRDGGKSVDRRYDGVPDVLAKEFRAEPRGKAAAKLKR